MSKRKIYIGKTYETTMGSIFTVAKIEKGKEIYNNRGHLKYRKPRVAINASGERLSITKLKDETTPIVKSESIITDAYGGLGREMDESGFWDRDIF